MQAVSKKGDGRRHARGVRKGRVRFDKFHLATRMFDMDWKIFGTAFLTLFLAELGDKTQLAVITMTASTDSKIAVFLGAAAALVVVTLLGVLLGGILSEYVPTEWLQRIVACGFIVIGVLMLFGKL
jgi:putative Ca2+/H+ antiporter (TMEM165/GDT1 family)